MVLFSPTSSSFQFMINYFWNMKQMGPIQGMFGEQLFGDGGYVDDGGGYGSDYDCVGDIEPFGANPMIASSLVASSIVIFIQTTP